MRRKLASRESESKYQDGPSLSVKAQTQVHSLVRTAACDILSDKQNHHAVERCHSQSTRGRSKTEAGRIQRQQPRRYHLNLSTKAGMRMATSTTIGSRIASRAVKHDLAVLVEKHEKNHGVDRAQKMVNQLMQELEQAQKDESQDHIDDSASRRRPVATDAETARKHATHEYLKRLDAGRGTKIGAVDSLPSWWNFSDDLAAQLQSIALEEVSQQQEARALTEKPHLKFQPKPAKPRKSYVGEQWSHKTQAPTISTKQMESDEDDYVYDIFIRTLPPEGQSSQSNMSKATDVSNIGVVVIEEGEEESWNDFLEDEDSGPEWSSEEDENGTTVSEQ